MKQKFLLVLAIVLGILVYNPTTIVKATDSSAAVTQTGWQSIGGKWYYFNQDGTKYTGWLKYNDRNYYLNADGSMATGWVFTKGEYQYLDA